MFERPTPRVAICVSEGRRRRIESALDGDLAVRALASFASLVDELPFLLPVEAIVLDPRDSAGGNLRTAVARIERIAPDTSIVLYATMADVADGTVTSSGAHDFILAEETDTTFAIQHLIFNAVGRRAAGYVITALRKHLPDPVAAFAETAVRFPSLTSVEAVTEHMGIHRQTVAVWTRKHACPHPEELLHWSRLLLLARLLEKTNRSVGALAVDLEFPSVIALRNCLKRYTGMTAMEVRSAGFAAVLGRFEARLSASHAKVPALETRDLVLAP